MVLLHASCGLVLAGLVAVLLVACNGVNTSDISAVVGEGPSAEPLASQNASHTPA
ncbi:MAG: hypothetical protein VKO21_03290 [Candidatus Sericytochromatia bacterium]|nr:hypothetical protein [Candidatus Sericytochromatia bacterium]